MIIIGGEFMLEYMDFLRGFTLIFALTIDAFVAAIAYGTSKIKIPITSAIFISVICSFILWISMFLGEFISNFIPIDLSNKIAFWLLFLVGLIKIFESLIKKSISIIHKKNDEIAFHCFNLKFILHIYGDLTKADKDKSRVLSPIESIYLATALSIDSIAVGFGVVLLNINMVFLCILSLLVTFLSVFLGGYIGRSISKKTNMDFSFVSGILIILLAVFKIF